MIECQADYIMSCLKQMLDFKIKSIEVKEEKTQNFRREMDIQSLTRNFTGSCKGRVVSSVRDELSSRA